MAESIFIDGVLQKDHFLACADVNDLLDALPMEPLFDLVLTSPPYNLGKEYEKRRPLEDYFTWQRGIIEKIVPRLKDTGSLCWQVGVIANDICKKKIHMGAKEYSAVEAMENNTIPVLFIHGMDERLVPVEMTYENYKACAAPKRLFVVPGADHGMSYYVDREGYEKQLLEF